MRKPKPVNPESDRALEATRSMMDKPDTWPLWPLLPLVQKGTSKLGCLLATDSEDITVTVYNVNVYNHTKYYSLEAMVADGWRVN